ncbi:hypothetical protein DFS34DRAFT_319186 [Phlyctochytrium arcticum]|nr:hypothetical protein DFS34DRAFT_319186 [Phlyctochytrium arcticum]
MINQSIPSFSHCSGEIMSLSDQVDRSLRHEDVKKKGKFVDYLFKVNFDHEMGVGENSGSDAQPHHDHARENFVDLVKTVKSQVHAVVRSLSSSTEIKLWIPFFHVVGSVVTFYVGCMTPETDGLFVVYEWSAVSCPKMRGHAEHIAELVESFLAFRAILKLQHKELQRKKRATKFAARLPHRPNSFVGIKTILALESSGNVYPQLQALVCESIISYHSPSSRRSSLLIRAKVQVSEQSPSVVKPVGSS